jgi:hypothetical protein
VLFVCYDVSFRLFALCMFSCSSLSVSQAKPIPIISATARFSCSLSFPSSDASLHLFFPMPAIHLTQRNAWVCARVLRAPPSTSGSAALAIVMCVASSSSVPSLRRVGSRGIWFSLSPYFVFFSLAAVAASVYVVVSAVRLLVPFCASLFVIWDTVPVSHPFVER